MVLTPLINSHVLSGCCAQWGGWLVVRRAQELKVEPSFGSCADGFTWGLRERLIDLQPQVLNPSLRPCGSGWQGRGGYINIFYIPPPPHAIHLVRAADFSHLLLRGCWRPTPPRHQTTQSLYYIIYGVWSAKLTLVNFAHILAGWMVPKMKWTRRSHIQTHGGRRVCVFYWQGAHELLCVRVPNLQRRKRK